MAVQTDDDPKDQRKFALVITVLGLVVGVATAIFAYLFTWGGLGPEPGDPERKGGASVFILLGIICTIALLVAGAATYYFERQDRKWFASLEGDARKLT